MDVKEHKIISPDDKGKNDNDYAASSWIVKVGKPLRKFINPVIRRSSKVGNTPVLDPAKFPWAEELANNWQTIRAEAEDVLKYRQAIPSISTISPDHSRLDAQKKWRSFFMWGYGFKSDFNCSRAPQTTALVEKIPGLSTAMFSIHEPGMCITPHKGVTAGICVFHLGLIVPKNRENCAIRVDDQIYHWKEGEGFVFDDTFEHETWNKTNEQRAILLLHVKRPMRFPGSLLAALFMGAVRRTSFIQDALNSMKEWEESYKAMEAADHNQKAVAE
ncbi:MAG: aspartyl/asparaginyl beta-hydroxylase domain-containing protein [Hellea sp.]|nr:aspartyl/asparaginyl beta-hydroxylase domain-containing protein [Hellea sp.]